jgi:hypothetical protein
MRACGRRRALPTSGEFNELHVNESSRLTTQTVTTMAELWEIEADIGGQDPATRVKARQERSAAIVSRLFHLWNRRSVVRAHPTVPQQENPLWFQHHIDRLGLFVRSKYKERYKCH